MARLQCGVLVEFGRSTDMEGSHGQLRSRLTDGLSRDDPDGFTDIHQVAVGQITSVTHGAYPVLRATGQNRTDINPLNTGAVDFFRQGLVNHLVGRHNDFIGERIPDFLKGDTPQNTFPGGFNDLTALHQSRNIDAVNGLAILLGDDAVLGHIDQPSGQIAGVGRFQRRVRQTLTGAVCRNEVLEHGETFAEVRRNRRLDKFPGGLRHQSAHTGQLS